MTRSIHSIQYALLSLFAVLVKLEYCDSFLSGHPGTFGVVSRFKQQLSAVEKETLLFSAEFDLKSDLLPCNDTNLLSDFLKSPILRNHFLSSGGRMKMEELDWTIELENMWIDASDRVYGIESIPRKENNDTVVSSVAIIDFPGVKVTNTVLMGTKQLEDSNGFPYYRTILIADRRKVSGLPPAVWLYNKLTTSSVNPDIEYNPVSGGVDSTISIYQEKPGDYVIRYVASVKIGTEFPKTMMKILPISKEKMEEQGSKSIRKTLEKEIVYCRDSVVEQYEFWNSSRYDI